MCKHKKTNNIGYLKEDRIFDIIRLIKVLPPLVVG